MNPAQQEGLPTTSTTTPDGSAGAITSPAASPGILGGLRSKLNVLTGGQASDGSQPAPEPGSTTSWPLSKPVQPGTPPYHEEVSAFATTPAEQPPPVVAAIPEPAPGAVVEPAVSPVWPQTPEPTPAPAEPTATPVIDADMIPASAPSAGPITPTATEGPVDNAQLTTPGSTLEPILDEKPVNPDGIPLSNPITDSTAGEIPAGTIHETGGSSIPPEVRKAATEAARQAFDKAVETLWSELDNPSPQAAAPEPSVPTTAAQPPAPVSGPETSASAQYGDFNAAIPAPETAMSSIIPPNPPPPPLS